MARKQRKVKSQPAEVEMNMTPMIDCVFLLIVFFMLVSEFTKLDQHKLELPTASQAIVDEEPGKVVINIDHEGEVFVQGKQYTDTSLMNLLKEEAHLAPKGKDGFPLRQVKVRVDKRTEYRHVQKVMMMCMKNYLWKMSFAATHQGD